MQNICVINFLNIFQGGLRAVVWTDVLQMILMIVGAFSVMIIGVHKAGGIENVWGTNEMAGRVKFFQFVKFFILCT